MRAASVRFGAERVGRAVALTSALACVSPALAKQSEPELSKYDCTLPDATTTISGDQLAAQGYQLANRSRFGEVNLMMIKPGSESLVNCFKRQGAAN